MTYRILNKFKYITAFLFVIIVGYTLFVAPVKFFQVTGFNGGFSGINLLITAFFQFHTITALILFTLGYLKKPIRDIGLTSRHWKKDVLRGLSVGLGWTLIQFAVFIPNTGGAERDDITNMMQMMDGTFGGLLSYLALGVIAGGITEELYNRGFFIGVLSGIFKTRELGMRVASVLSVLFFVLSHFPRNLIDCVDTLIPALAYTWLFFHTGRLMPSMVAHGTYNLLAIVLIYYFYFP